MRRRYNPADYHSKRDPSLEKRNAPWLFLGIVASLAAILGFGWDWFAPDIHLGRPELQVENGKATVTTLATNRTMQPVTLKVRFAVGGANRGGQHHVGSMREHASKEVVQRIPAGTSAPISCDFPASERRPNHAEVLIVDMGATDRL